jgi:hypothetical protein
LNFPEKLRHSGGATGNLNLQASRIAMMHRPLTHDTHFLARLTLGLIASLAAGVASATLVQVELQGTIVLDTFFDPPGYVREDDLHLDGASYSGRFVYDSDAIRVGNDFEQLPGRWAAGYVGISGEHHYTNRPGGFADLVNINSRNWVYTSNYDSQLPEFSDAGFREYDEVYFIPTPVEIDGVASSIEDPLVTLRFSNDYLPGSGISRLPIPKTEDIVQTPSWSTSCCGGNYSLTGAMATTSIVPVPAGSWLLVSMGCAVMPFFRRRATD